MTLTPKEIVDFVSTHKSAFIRHFVSHTERGKQLQAESDISSYEFIHRYRRYRLTDRVRHIYLYDEEVISWVDMYTLVAFVKGGDL